MYPITPEFMKMHEDDLKLPYILFYFKIIMRHLKYMLGSQQR